jgi:hypothetical protein
MAYHERLFAQERSVAVMLTVHDPSMDDRAGVKIEASKEVTSILRVKQPIIL